MWSFKAGCVYECVSVCVFVKGGGYFLFLKRRYLERGCVSLLLFFLRGLPLFLRAGREEGGGTLCSQLQGGNLPRLWLQEGAVPWVCSDGCCSSAGC